MQNSDTKICVRFDLHGEDAERFTQLLKKRGLTQNAELCRQLLKEAEDKELAP